MDNQNPQASAPVTPSGAAYTPPMQPATPIASPADPLTPPPSSKNKMLLILGIAVLLLLIGGGGYFYFMNMQTPQPTVNQTVTTNPSPTRVPTATPMASPSATASSSANWKTYTSLDKTYTIQYPADTFIRYICPQEELTLTMRKNEKEDTVTMPTCARDALYDIEVITLTQPSIPPKSDENYAIVKKDITVDGTPAQEYTRTLIKEPEGPFIEFSKDVYVTKNGKYYQLHVGSKDLTDTFEQMLTTFKFTK